MRAATLLAASALWGALAQELISPGGGYPRLLQLAGSNATLAVVEMGAPRRLELFRRDSPASPWVDFATVVTDSSQGVDLANGFLFQLPSSNILCAYRHHTPSGGETTYRIQVSVSSNLGRTWKLLSTIIETSIGVWEPFVMVSPLNASLLRVLYSAELTNGGQQDVVQQTSVDGGASWTPIDMRIHSPFSGRNGMPGVALLPNGALLCVFERPILDPGWGHFTVNGALSTDGGATYGAPFVIYDPGLSSGFNAGSPQVAYCPHAGSIVVVYMCDAKTATIAGGGGDNNGEGLSWPESARLWVSNGTVAPGSGAITWGPGAPVAGTGSPFVYWPSVFYEAGPGGLPVVLHAAYQGSDGGAWLDSAGGALLAHC